MPPPKDLLEEMAARRYGEHVTANRDKRRDLIRCALLCLLWCALGVGCILWAAHTTNPWLGRAAFYAGNALGYAGVIFTLLGAYRRGEKRGDW